VKQTRTVGKALGRNELAASAASGVRGFGRGRVLWLRPRAQLVASATSTGRGFGRDPLLTTSVVGTACGSGHGTGSPLRRWAGLAGSPVGCRSGFGPSEGTTEPRRLAEGVETPRAGFGRGLATPVGAVSTPCDGLPARGPADARRRQGVPRCNRGERSRLHALKGSKCSGGLPHRHSSQALAFGR